VPKSRLRETVATPRAIAAFLNPARHESVATGLTRESRRRKKGGWRRESVAMMQLGLAMRELSDAAAEDGDDVMVAPGNQLASLLQSYIAEKAASSGDVRNLATGGKEIAFEEGDGDDPDITGWAKTLPHILARKLFGPGHKVVRPDSDEPGKLPDTARVAIIGDWGTGMYGAPESAKTLENETDLALTMHLGDIYYSGTEKEVQSRFLDLWPKRTGKKTLRRALNGNHEMYAGGDGYFKKVLPAFRQASSYFALQNSDWTLIGLDTAHLGGGKDHDIDAEQARWVGRVVEQSGERKVILFSHHQPYSSIGKQGPKLQARLQKVLKSGKVFAWYWGHEHRCMLYDKDANSMLGRCVGHGGIPYSRKAIQNAPVVHTQNSYLLRELPATAAAPRSRILDGPNYWVKNKEQIYGPNGHMILEFDGGKLNERICAPDGLVAWERTLTT